MRIENENFHAGDVLKHPIDVIAGGGDQHHFRILGLSMMIRRRFWMKAVEFCSRYGKFWREIFRSENDDESTLQFVPLEMEN